MGIHISLSRLQNNQAYDFKLIFTEVPNDFWNGLRHSGDKEVDAKVEKIWMKLEEDNYWRPKNMENFILELEQIWSFEVAQRWVPCLNRIKDDYTYWFSSSY